MSRREIFLIVSLFCLGIFLLVGAYLCKQSVSSEKAANFTADSQSKQLDNTNINNSSNLASKAASIPANTANTEEKTITSTSTSPTSSKSTAQQNSSGSAANSTHVASNTAPATSLINNLIIPQEFKVGDFVKLGNLEMIVTKSTTRHKILDITLTGNNTNQVPQLILNEKNHIIYEIPADTAVSMDISEKVVVDKSPIFNTP